MWLFGGYLKEAHVNDRDKKSASVSEIHLPAMARRLTHATERHERVFHLYARAIRRGRLRQGRTSTRKRQHLPHFLPRIYTVSEEGLRIKTAKFPTEITRAYRKRRRYSVYGSCKYMPGQPAWKCRVLCMDLPKLPSS